MDQIQLKELKNDYAKFIMHLNELNRAKNQKERARITKVLDALKSQIISTYDLMEYDIHISHYQNNNQYFKDDVGSIINELEV